MGIQIIFWFYKGSIKEYKQTLGEEKDKKFKNVKTFHSTYLLYLLETKIVDFCSVTNPGYYLLQITN